MKVYELGLGIVLGIDLKVTRVARVQRHLLSILGVWKFPPQRDKVQCLLHVVAQRIVQRGLRVNQVAAPAISGQPTVQLAAHTRTTWP